MRVRTLTVGVLVVGAVVGIAVGGDRILLTHRWDHPCPDPQELTCGMSRCWCEADWDDADNWHGDGYPDADGDYALIRESNTGHCDGGVNDGEPCSEEGDCDVCVGGLHDGESCIDDDDCPGYCESTQKPCFYHWQCGTGGRGNCLDIGSCSDTGTCDDFEDWAVISLITEQIFRLDIETAPTNATEDKFNLHFDSSSTKTLYVGHLEIDAEFGPVTVQAKGDATLETY